MNSRSPEQVAADNQVRNYDTHMGMNDPRPPVPFAPGYDPNAPDRGMGSMMRGTGATPGNPMYGQNPQMQQMWGQRPAMSGGMFGDPRMQQFQRPTPTQQIPQQAQAAVQPQQQLQNITPPPQQSFEQFQQTFANGGAGMSTGQMQDMYQKSLQPASTNFWGNAGVGTQKPPGFQTPAAWGTQTYGFDPRSLSGKQVTPDMAWYYGRDSIGRNINQAGDAYASFNPAFGGGRSRPWFK
jgi:hypothetical protein